MFFITVSYCYLMMDNTPHLLFFFVSTYYFQELLSGNIKFLRIKLEKENCILLLVKEILNSRMNQKLKELKYLTLISQNPIFWITT